jgi:hypothetical protein
VQEDPVRKASHTVSRAINYLEQGHNPTATRHDKQEAVRLATACVQAARLTLHATYRPNRSNRYVMSARHHLRKWDNQPEGSRLNNLDCLQKARRRLQRHRCIPRPLRA